MRNPARIATMMYLLFACALSFIVANGADGAEKSVIIGFKQRPGIQQESVVHMAQARIERRFHLIPAVVATVPEEEIENLRKNSEIAYVEENAVYRAETMSTGDEGDLSWQIPHTFADDVHASGNLGTGVAVAILDTGIDYTHEELDGNFRGGYDFVFGDDDPFDDSYNSHGTHVAGIIAAEKNGVGVVGMAPEADIYAVKVLDGGGFGLLDWIIAGIEWAVSNNVDIINMSLSGPERQSFRDACEQAGGEGILVVAAGGNSLAGGGPVSYPAAYDSVIAVTATDMSDLPGFNSPLGDTLELAAPGVDVFSTVAGGDYGSLSGTSQAAACVSGIAALYIRSLVRDLNGDGYVNSEDVRLALQLTAIDLGDPGRDEVYGYGLVNASAASFDVATTVTLTKAARTRGTTIDDSQVAKLTDAVYSIGIYNDGLRAIAMKVYEGETLRTDLSRPIMFGPSRRRQAYAVRLNAIDTSYTVIFTPIGPPVRPRESSSGD